MLTLLPPRLVPWSLKPISSAESEVRQLPDGRLQMWIRHDTLKGIDLDMLYWWFNNLEGKIQIDGNEYYRYQIWHPVDHIKINYKNRDWTKPVGAGTIICIKEILNADPRFSVDVESHVRVLNRNEFVHGPLYLGGFTPGILEYQFKAVPGGVLYENQMTIGAKGYSVFAKGFNKFARKRIFSDEQGVAWIKHNIEEVGCFEHFLPALYQLHQK